MGGDQSILPSLGQLNLDNLKRDALYENLFKFNIDSFSQCITLLLSFGPEIIWAKCTDGGSHSGIYERDHGCLITLLIGTVKIGDLVLLNSVLQRNGQSHGLTVIVLNVQRLRLGALVIGEVEVHKGGWEHDKVVPRPDPMPTASIYFVTINSFRNTVVLQTILNRLYSANGE